MAYVQHCLKIMRLVGVVLITLTGIFSAQAQSSPLCDEPTFRQKVMTAAFHQVGDKTILLLSGGFDPGAAARVKGKIRQKRYYSEVWMCSPGGRVDQGMEIGRTLSAERATVRVPNGFRCVSSCTISFLGGFVRIIEPDAQYIVHASSAYLSLDINGRLILDCKHSSTRQLCETFLKDIGQEETAHCSSMAALQDPKSTCFLFDPNRRFKSKTDIAFSMRYITRLPAYESILKLIVEDVTRGQVRRTSELLQYYQEMLLSGRKNYIKRASYDAITRNFRPVALYDSQNYGRDARLLSDDIFTMKASKTIFDRASIWQQILTDAELNVKRQIVDHIKASSVNLGPAGGDAVRILDAMLICQIQTLCRLKQDEAKALGIHNVHDAQ